MSLLSSSLSAGNIVGTIYTFEKAGDILAMHTHDEESVHITIVARGKIKARGLGWEMDKSAGAVIDFPPNQAHEFVALEDNSRIVNIIK